MLFPAINSVVDTYVGSDTDVVARRRKRRLSLRDFSEAYFALSPPAGSWGQTEFETALRSTPQEAFDTLQRKLESAPESDRSDLRRIFVELLDSEFRTGKKLDETWLNAIVGESPAMIAERDEERRSLFSVDNQDRLRWLIVNGLANLPPEEAEAVLMSAIRSASDLSILADVVRGIIGDVNPEGAKRDAHRIRLDENAVRETLLDRVRSLAGDGSFWKQVKPENLLWFWWGADKALEVLNFTNKEMDTPSGLRGLLSSSINTVLSSAGNYERVSPTWSKIVDLHALKQRALKLQNSDNEADIKLAHRFLTAHARGQSSSF